MQLCCLFLDEIYKIILLQSRLVILTNLGSVDLFEILCL